MSRVILLGDACSGHGCFPPRPTITGQGNFIVEGKPVHCVGDSLAPHTCVSTHGGVSITGSSKFFVNGVAIARSGDAIDCGSIHIAGSGKFLVTS